MHGILIVDASEEMRPLAASLDEAGFVTSHAPMDRVLDESQTNAPAVILFSLFGRPDTPSIRNLLRSPQMPHGIASIAVIRSDQLATFDFSIGFDDFVVYPALSDEISARVRRAIWMKSGVESDNTLQALQFSIRDVGSSWTETTVTHKLNHKGKAIIIVSKPKMIDKQKK